MAERSNHCFGVRARYWWRHLWARLSWHEIVRDQVVFIHVILDEGKLSVVQVSG